MVASYIRSKFSLLALIITVLVVFSPHAQAYKLASHIWVAEQVWDDVSADGAVNIPPFGEIAVSPHIVDSLRNHKDVYLAGSIGPDGYPDMIGGQMTTHPGTDGGWKTDDWAGWLLNNIPQESGTQRNKAIAFTYGYFSHLSADVFGHSYVNTYAGDTFQLFDNETTVETRHVMIEGYIDNHTPIVNPQLKVATGEGLPLDWLANTLIMNPDVEAQYSINQSNDYSTHHLYLMHQYEDSINEIIDVAESHQSILDAALYEIADTIVQETPPELLSPAHAALSVGNTLCEQVISDAGNEFSLDLNPVDYIFPTVSATTHVTSDAVEDVVGVNVYDEVSDFVQDVGDALIYAVGEDGALCLMMTGQACIANYALTETINRLPDEIICLAANPTACMNVYYAEKYCEISAEVVAIHEQFVQQSIYGAAILLMRDQYLGGAIHYLTEWRKTMQPMAKSWISLSSEISSGVMVGQSPEDKVYDWLECWGLVFAGGTSQVVLACDSVGNLMNSTLLLYEDLQNIKQEINYATLNLIGIGADAIVSDIEDGVKALKGRAQEFVVEEVVPYELRNVLDSVLNGVTASSLNEEFAVDNTRYALNKKHLIEVPRMAERMRKEMHVIEGDSGSHFTYDKFPPIYNSVILSKLALLNAEQLNELALRAGMSRSLYQVGQSDHVLINAIRSIDGNHQWMAKAPPFPRQEIAPDPAATEHFFGYELSSTHGFRIYQDEEARSKIFNRIFKGLLAAGIEKPSAIDEATVLPSSYPYRPCPAVPYPNGVEDQSCAVEYLVPILSNILSSHN